MTGVADGFKQRLKRRRAKWWGHPFRWTSAASYTRIPHRLAERVAWRSANDPDEAWRCCNAWPRTLINKWNRRQYALKHGCRVADLYWFGRSPRRIPFDALPPQFVIRPVHGYGRRGVLVVADGQELLRGGFAAFAIQGSYVLPRYPSAVGHRAKLRSRFGLRILDHPLPG